MAVSLREYNNDDYPPFIYLFQPLEFRVVKIERRIDIVRYSFLAQRSITYLDLSTSEYSKREKRIFTTEAFRNRIDNRRRTLYKFHLDLTKELDPGPPKSVKYDVVVTDLSKHVCTDDDFCFYFLRIQISCRPVYGQECAAGLIPCITTKAQILGGFGSYRSIDSTKTKWYSIFTCFAQTSDKLPRLTQAFARMKDVMNMIESNLDHRLFF